MIPLELMFRCSDVHVGVFLSLWPREKCRRPLAHLFQMFSLKDPGARERIFCYMRIVVEMGLRSKCCCCWPAPPPQGLLLLRMHGAKTFVTRENFPEICCHRDVLFQLWHLLAQDKIVWTRVISTFFYGQPSRLLEKYWRSAHCLPLCHCRIFLHLPPDFQFCRKHVVNKWQPVQMTSVAIK